MISNGFFDDYRILFLPQITYQWIDNTLFNKEMHKNEDNPVIFLGAE